MQKTWSKLNEHDNLFDYWDYELHIRKEFRDNFNFNQLVKVDNHDQIEFLFRSLYLCNKKLEFFFLLIPNLNKATALNWLKTVNLPVMKSFLQWLPEYIANYEPTVEQLQFLVHIYNSELDEYFIPVFNSLSLSQCKFISHRTANKGLRNLLKNRQNEILDEKDQFFYGLKSTKNISPYSTLHGDKVEIILETLNHLHKNQTLFNEPTNKKSSIASLLPLAELLFEVGLIEDSLYLLLTIHEHYQNDDVLIDYIENDNIWKEFNKLIRRVLPVYALLYQPQAFNFTLQIYDQYLPGLTPDVASLTYLKLYQILALKSESFSNTLFELYQEILKIRQMRPDEIPLLLDDELEDGIPEYRFFEILHLAESKLASLPHEAFITLEFLRQLVNHNFASKIGVETLAPNYLSLFRWLPSSLFMNISICEDLISSAKLADREQLEKTINLLTYYDNNSILLDIKEKPELFRLKNEELNRIILTGKFMGAL